MDAPEILLVILSVFLAIFLALGITLLVYAIRVARHIEMITQKAEIAADNISKASEFFKKTAGPAAIGKLLLNIFESVKRNKRKGED